MWAGSSGDVGSAEERAACGQLPEDAVIRWGFRPPRPPEYITTCHTLYMQLSALVFTWRLQASQGRGEGTTTFFTPRATLTVSRVSICPASPHARPLSRHLLPLTFVSTTLPAHLR